MYRYIIIVVLNILATTSVAGGEPLPAPAPRRVPVEELVEQLGSTDAAARAAAAERLGAIAVDPPPELLAAARSADAALRERATAVAQMMRWNAAATRLPRGLRFAEQGRADLFVAATEVWDLKADDDRLWQPAVDFGRHLIEKAELKGDRRPHNCPSWFRDYAAYKRLMPPRFVRAAAPYERPDPQAVTPPVLYLQQAVQAPGVTDVNSISCSLIVSRGEVRTGRIFQASTILANGDVSSKGAILCCVIVSDGDVTVSEQNVTSSLVIARGNISVKGSVSTSTLIAGGKVTIGAQKKSTISGHYNVIKEDEPNALGYVTFFELSRVGLQVKAADGAVRLAAVAARGAGERAGMRADDVVLGVGGKRPADAEAFRRLLRDALATGEATVTLKRGDKTEAVKLALPE